jgi:hypothetical protein
MSFLRRQKVRETPRPVDPADTQNRIDDQRRRRLSSGGRASTFLAEAVQAASTPAPPATLTGVG